LKCSSNEGTINVYRYLRAREHRSSHGRMLNDGDIVSCLRETIVNHSHSLDQSFVSTGALSLTLPILTPPSPIRLTRTQVELRRAEINKIYRDPIDEQQNQTLNSNESM
jgi:hypothetical protein